MLNDNKLNSNQQLTISISKEKLDEFIEAVLNGKYSWACVIIFKAVALNALDYIPYRTYNRLLKENKSNETLTTGMTSLEKLKVLEQKKKRPGGNNRNNQTKNNPSSSDDDDKKPPSSRRKSGR
jgi:hypothetical protein